MNKSFLFLLNRLFDNGEETLGILYYRDELKKLRYHFCLEDEFRKVKVAGETRIRAGEYEISMRFEGSFYERYSNNKNKDLATLVKKYGIPWLKDVPGFEWILMHPGNKDSDTNGCLLSGMTANNFSREKGFIGDSVTAFTHMMRAIGATVDSEMPLNILINDLDRSAESLI